MAKPNQTKPEPREASKLTPAPSGANEGEGSRSAGRHYDDQATAFARSGKVEPSAREARKYVDTQDKEDKEDKEDKAMAKALDRAEGEGMGESPPVTQGTSGKHA